eukprot:5298463-Pyramimonas_sp.AAC.1
MFAGRPPRRHQRCGCCRASVHPMSRALAKCRRGAATAHPREKVEFGRKRERLRAPFPRGARRESRGA